MRAGLLKERVEIWRQVETENEYGEKSITYQLYKSYRANVEHKLGTRTVENEEIVYDYSKTFTLRYFADVEDKDRIKYGDKFYQVQSVEKDRDNQRTIVLTAQIND